MELLDYTLPAIPPQVAIIPPAHALARIAGHFGRRINGAGFLRMPCPAHGSKGDSLSLWADKGIAARCFAGCQYQDIVAALEAATGLNLARQEADGYGTPDRRPQAAPIAEGPLSYAEVAALLGTAHLGPGEVRQPQPQPPARPQADAEELPPVSASDSELYLVRMARPVGGRIRYRNTDGRTALHIRRAGKLVRNPGMTGGNWQPRRFDPFSPNAATAIVVAEGEKDAALSALAGFVAYAMPGGSTRAETAAWPIVAHAALDLGLPVVMAGDNDDVGRKARKVVTDALAAFGVKTLPLSLAASDPGGSPVDLPDFADRVAELISPADSWQRPRRPNTEGFKCLDTKRIEHLTAGGQKVFKLVPCSGPNCQPCEAWAAELHLLRVMRGHPSLALVYGGFNALDGGRKEAADFRAAFGNRWRTRLWRFLPRYEDLTPSEKSTQNLVGQYNDRMTCLSPDPASFDSRFVVYLRATPRPEVLTAEATYAASKGLTLDLIAAPSADTIRDLAPEAMTLGIGHCQGDVCAREGTAKKNGSCPGHRLNLWSSSNWPDWETPVSTYELNDGKQVEPDKADVTAIPYRPPQVNGFTPEARETELEALALANAEQWFDGVTLNVEALDQPFADMAADRTTLAAQRISALEGYSGPCKLVTDALAAIAGRQRWRPAFGPVLRAVGLEMPGPVVPEPPDNRLVVCAAPDCGREFEQILAESYCYYHISEA